jgi:Short C-terminal domain
VLFLLRPRQAWMPFALPRDMTTQAGYRRSLSDGSAAPYAPPTPPTAPPDATARLRQLGELHQSGALTDAEFATAKAQVLAED